MTPEQYFYLGTAIAAGYLIRILIEYSILFIVAVKKFREERATAKLKKQLFNDLKKSLAK